ncbi:hypothetical protein SAMN04489806_2201 [Paramicrobacterium humi]|uniref:Uncharacterized protein n=1 Tax=Paramicrobacterium humi TaxID=640635 RepID=A0A1H4NHJ3_9MICO|nr:hypothetical protein [Microbacterium humi]SEB94770.1 hypothetical protein SAMN04489806_2201 [Microbacterium humi]
MAENKHNGCGGEFDPHAPNTDLERGAVRERRASVIDASAGSLDEAYGDGYLDELRADWPS